MSDFVEVNGLLGRPAKRGQIVEVSVQVGTSASLSAGTTSIVSPLPDGERAMTVNRAAHDTAHRDHATQPCLWH